MCVCVHSVRAPQHKHIYNFFVESRFVAKLSCGVESWIFVISMNE